MCKAAAEVGFESIFTSKSILRMVPRAHSTVANAYLTPKLTKHLQSFLQGFDTLDDSDFSSKVYFMRSDGGLCSISSVVGSEAVLSGPAGGVVGTL